MTEDLGVYYRYYDELSAGGYYGVDGIPRPPSVKIKLEEFKITKKTPKGVYISRVRYIHDHYENEQLILDHWSKKYAYPTKEEAQKDFLRRKRNQLAIHEERALRAREAYNTACFEFKQESEIPRTADLRQVYGKDILSDLSKDLDDDVPY